MVFNLVNRDTGEVVGDIRDGTGEPVPFDVLPKGFRPAEAWHPELQVRKEAFLKLIKLVKLGKNKTSAGT